LKNGSLAAKPDYCREALRRIHEQKLDVKSLWTLRKTFTKLDRCEVQCAFFTTMLVTFFEWHLIECNEPDNYDEGGSDVEEGDGFHLFEH